MDFNSYIVSETKIAETLPLVCLPPPPYRDKGFGIKRKAFTLAETLITLAIIGVIAALTVPTLLNKYQKHTYVAGLKKAYSELSNAVKMIPITEGCPAGDYECAGAFVYRVNGGIQQTQLLAKHFRTVKEVFEYPNNDELCKQLYDKLGGHGSNNGGACFYTADGMTIASSSGVYVDINGIKGPNKVGRDQFVFYIEQGTGNGIQPGTVTPGGAYSNDWKSCTTESVNSGSWGASRCAYRVLKEDAMNY